MIIFFMVLIILFLLSVLSLLLCFSNLEIEVNKLMYDSNNKNSQKLEDYLFFIRLKISDKITWLRIKINKEKIKRIEKCNFFNKINKYENIKDIIIKNKDEIFKRSNINYIKEINLEIKQLDLYMEFCTSNSMLTSFSVVIIAYIISILLAKNVENFKSNKYRYSVNPKYQEELALKIKLNCIISLKMVHIINVIYMLIKKRSVENDERTSNRRTYESIDE